MNVYIRNLNRIEFVVTAACTGKCRHCSEGGPADSSGSIDAETAADAVRKICKRYKIESVMTFGGESLLFPDVVCAIHKAASEAGVGKRQLITNGFFSNSYEKIEETVCDLEKSGVNDLLLSVDAFHQEFIPLGPVMYFAKCVAKSSIPLRLNPAWLVSPGDDNPYNVQTRKIIAEFEQQGIPLGPGNVVFPRGNALKYLGQYFKDNADGPSPYDEDPEDIGTVSFLPNGDVLNGNVYKTDILDILDSYRP